MKNKKGFWLGTKFLSILIAVICIIALVAMGGKVFNITLKDQTAEKQAKTSLNIIKTNLDIAEANPGICKDFFIENPAGWYITSWPDSEGNYPKQCILFGYAGSCMCICKPSSKIIDGCNEKAVCMRMDKETKIYQAYNYIKIQDNGITPLYSAEFLGAGALTSISEQYTQCKLVDHSLVEEKGNLFVKISGTPDCRPPWNTEFTVYAVKKEEIPADGKLVRVTLDKSGIANGIVYTGTPIIQDSSGLCFNFAVKYQVPSEKLVSGEMYYYAEVQTVGKPPVSTGNPADNPDIDPNKGFIAGESFTTPLIKFTK